MRVNVRVRVRVRVGVCVHVHVRVGVTERLFVMCGSKRERKREKVRVFQWRKKALNDFLFSEASG